MADKDSKSTERAGRDAQNMTERSPGSRDMGGKEAGSMSRQNPTEDGPAVVGGRVGDQANPTPQGQTARGGTAASAVGPVEQAQAQNAPQGAQNVQGAGLQQRPVDSPTAPEGAVAPMPTSNDPELGQTQVNTQPPHPGFVTGIGADPMQTRVGQTGPLRTEGEPGQARRGPVWLRNEAGENYLAPGEGPQEGDTMELVGPGGERWSVEVAAVHGEQGEPEHRADVLIRGVAMPGGPNQGGARMEFPS